MKYTAQTLPDHIRITATPGAELATFLDGKRYSKIAVVTDNHTHRHCYPLLQDHLPDHELFIVPSGEEHKNLETCTVLWREMTQNLLDRHSVLIVVGGGVLGDLAGFCAATYKRGIDFVLIPTTLLAQADASIGGKLGIDFDHYKNHIGVFQQPVLTLLCSGFLGTLPATELKSGFAEVIKHTLISDWNLWKTISGKPLESQDWGMLLLHSVSFKYSIILEDPIEKGRRKVLNAGHTVGHALESYLLQRGRKITHGEAVAAGLVAEAYLSCKAGFLSHESLVEIRLYIHQVFGRISIRAEELGAVAGYALQDKKNKGNKILTVLLKEGSAVWDCEITPDDVKAALTFYLSR